MSCWTETRPWFVYLLIYWFVYSYSQYWTIYLQSASQDVSSHNTLFPCRKHQTVSLLPRKNTQHNFDVQFKSPNWPWTTATHHMKTRHLTITNTSHTLNFEHLMAGVYLWNTWTEYVVFLLSAVQDGILVVRWNNSV